MMALINVMSVITLMTMVFITALKYKMALTTVKTDVPDDLDESEINDGLGACVHDGHDRDVLIALNDCEIDKNDAHCIHNAMTLTSMLVFKALMSVVSMMALMTVM
jgi:hypothetical protein